MSGFRSHRLWLTTAALMVISVASALLAAPAAVAGLNEETTVSTDPATSPPMMLASTGLDITVPIIIGLGALVLGTLMVGWAFLATGRRSQHRADRADAAQSAGVKSRPRTPAPGTCPCRARPAARR